MSQDTRHDALPTPVPPATDADLSTPAADPDVTRIAPSTVAPRAPLTDARPHTRGAGETLPRGSTSAVDIEVRQFYENEDVAQDPEIVARFDGLGEEVERSASIRVRGIEGRSAWKVLLAGHREDPPEARGRSPRSRNPATPRVHR